MDKTVDLRNSTAFKVKKWTLFAFCLVSIVGTIIMASLSSIIIDHYVDTDVEVHQKLTKEQIRSLKTMVRVIIFVVTAYGILFNLMGLVGAYKEHYCMTTTYAILMTLGTLGSIATAVNNPFYFTNTVLYFLVSALAFAFAYDLRRRRQLLFSAPVVVSQTPPTVAPIVVVPQAAQVAKQADGHQYAPVAQSEDIAPNEKYVDEEAAHEGAQEVSREPSEQ